jgi:uncharacterized oxidoreductase
MKITHKKILITGGASGLGLGFAERFIQDNNTVIICGRRASALQEAKEKLPSIITYPCDLSKEPERIKLYDWVSKEHPDLNVLVNNAGIQQWMNLTDAGFYQRAKEEIAINIEAVVHLNSLFLELKSLEIIMTVASGLSFAPLTKTPIYSASKAFIHSYSMSLRHLLKPRGIEVIEIVPPALNTDLGGKGIHDAFPAVSEFITAAFKQLEEGKNQLTMGFSDNMVKAGPEEIKQAFDRMNTPD